MGCDVNFLTNDFSVVQQASLSDRPKLENDLLQWRRVDNIFSQAFKGVLAGMIDKVRMDSDDLIVLVSYDQNKNIQGVLTAIDNGAQMSIEEICVNPTSMGRGVGSSLIKEVELLSLEKGKISVISDVSLSAIPFFEKKGYSRIGYVEVKRDLNSENQCSQRSSSDLFITELALKEGWTGYNEMSFPNGDTYKGNFLNGQMHGDGKLEFANGDIYTGEFTSGALTGTGTYYIGSTEDIIQGSFIDRILHGNATYTWGSKAGDSAGNVFKGMYDHGMESGYGVHTWPRGIEYQGEFKDGKLTGIGTKIWENGAKYEGEFVCGNLHGNGTLTYPDGTFQKGTFVENKFLPM